MSQKLKISELIPHEDNSFFFDDIQGDAWDEFLKSIETSGVIEPIVVTQDKVIVSGHQRVRACKKLGISEIEAEVRIFDSDDEVLKCLIETNIRQRGIGNPDPVKFGRCIKELERIYGVKVGNPHETNSENISELKTQDDIANELGMDVRTLRNYKQLADMIPEMQDLIETGVVTPTVARAIVNKLPEFQQKELAEKFAESDDKKTKKQVEEAVKKIKEEMKQNSDKAIADLQKRIEQREEEIQELEDELEEAKKKKKEGDGSKKADDSKMSSREKFEKNRADRLQKDKEKLEEELKELKKSITLQSDSSSNHSDDEASKELESLKAQTLANAKMELADFVKKYDGVLDVRELLEDCLSKI